MGVIDMAHRGPAQKPNRIGHSANADWTDIPDVPFDGQSPELPKMSRRKWHHLVEQWWSMVRVMPHCTIWGPTDWQFAVETAIMKDQFWREYEEFGEMKTTAATEIRRREDQMGTTSEARRKLRIRYVQFADNVTEAYDTDDGVEVLEQEHAGGGGTVTPLDSRRKRLVA